MTAVSDPGTPVSSAFAKEIRLERSLSLGTCRKSFPPLAEQLVGEQDSQRKVPVGLAFAKDAPSNAGTPAQATASAAPSLRRPDIVRAPVLPLAAQITKPRSACGACLLRLRARSSVRYRLGGKGSLSGCTPRLCFPYSAEHLNQSCLLYTSRCV